MLLMILDPKHTLSVIFQIICTMINDYHINLESHSQQ